MSEESILKEIFDSLTSFEGILDHIQFHIVSGIIMGTSAYAGVKLHALGAARALRHGRFVGPTAVIQTTTYAPTGILNPETNKEFRDQLIRTEEQPINLGDIFDKKMRPQILKYFNKAAKYCTPEEPIVFQHLDKVIKPKNLDVISNVISSQWKNYFGGMYRNTEMVLTKKLNNRQKLEERTIVPILIREEGAIQQQSRILLMDIASQGKNVLPDFANIRFPEEDGSFKANPDSYYADRYFVNQAVYQTLNKGGAQNELVSKYGVAIPTGRIVNVPKPQPPLAL
ncbi:MAG: hypothetical protein KDJ35_00890 [Alphaproteobacteria bacterium]|nr:hypothetical protein [Alphaproteobacteria bacterium]